MLIVRGGANYLRRVSMGIANPAPGPIPDPTPVPEAITGLDFPSNHQVADDNSASVRLRLINTACPPQYGTDGVGLNYLWKKFTRQQTGFYTTMFWANDDGQGVIRPTFEWNNNSPDSYYGFHEYPPGGSSGTSHEWEISVNADDYRNGTVVYDEWRSQFARVRGATGQIKNHEFYWDLPNIDSAHRVIQNSSASNWGDTPPPFPAVTFGDAPWQPGRECLSGILRGLQMYNNVWIDPADAVTLGEPDTNAEVLAVVSALGLGAKLWYLNMNPTPDDISDKSGNDHHPEWFNGNRPALWTE